MALGVLVVAKGLFAVFVGPIFMPDSGGYVAVAEILVGGTDWMWSVDLTGSRPKTAFRVIGYPVVIALAQAIAGAAWAWLVVVLQIGLSLLATAYVFRLALRLSGRSWVALFTALAHGLGQGLYLDQCILTDSLNASLLIIAASHMGLGILERRAPSFGEAAALGALVLGAFLLREAGAVLQVLLWPLVAWWGLVATQSAKRAVLVLVVFVVPMLAGTQAYKAWNQVRTGERFITTAGETAMFRPPLDLYRAGIDVFGEDPLLRDAPGMAAVKHERPYLYFNVVGNHLRTQHGFTAVDISNYGYALYVQHWRTYPLERLKVVMGKFDREYLYLPVMPIEASERVLLWAGLDSFLPKPGEIMQNLREDYRLDQAALLAMRSGFRVLSAVFMAVFVLAVPALVLRGLVRWRWRIAGLDPSVGLMATLWLMTVGYAMAYGFVHIEVRYLLPVMPFVVAVSAALSAPRFEQVVSRLANWRRS